MRTISIFSWTGLILHGKGQLFLCCSKRRFFYKLLTGRYIFQLKKYEQRKGVSESIDFGNMNFSSIGLAELVLHSLNAPNFRHITLDWQELKMRDQKAWSFKNLCIFKINCNLEKHWHIHIFVWVLKKELTAFRVLLTWQILLFKHCIGNNFSTCG